MCIYLTKRPADLRKISLPNFNIFFGTLIALPYKIQIRGIFYYVSRVKDGDKKYRYSISAWYE